MNVQQKYEVKPEQSIELLKELHILTVDGKMNQDSRRKLKQIYHLYQFIEPLLIKLTQQNHTISMVDHGSGKSYLGFILYDLFFKNKTSPCKVYSIESRDELVHKSQELARKLGFGDMHFFNMSISQSVISDKLPDNVDIVTALHACDTATDDAIQFALKKCAKFVVLVPCCQAEIARLLRNIKTHNVESDYLQELWRHPIHARELGSHITNVLRCLWLESCGYRVTVTELVGWEHSMKNELIIAEYVGKPNQKSRNRLQDILINFGLTDLQSRFC